MTVVTLKQFSVQLLASLAVTVNGEPAVLFLREEDTQELIDNGFAECNVASIDPNDATKVATRATQSGVDHLAALNTEPENVMDTNTTPQAPAGAVSFEIETAAMPARTRTRKSIYPFEQLAIGQRFFVPATDAMPDPGKTLATSVSGAVKRLGNVIGTKDHKRRPLLVDEAGNKVLGEDGKQAKGELTTFQVPRYDIKFQVASGEKDGIKGAYVGRVEPDAA